MAFGPIPFRVRAWVGFSAAPDPAAVKAIPPLLRRRVTALGRSALGAACLAGEGEENARYIFSSRHGEFSRTLAILKAIAAGEALSPIDFSMSVHHALASLLSIAKADHAGHIAIAAGTESLCLALVEAAGCLIAEPHVPVLLIHSDEPLPDIYGAFNPPDVRPISLALLLDSPAGGEGTLYSLEALASQGERCGAVAHDFLNFLQCSDSERITRAETFDWHWVRYGDR